MGKRTITIVALAALLFLIALICLSPAETGVRQESRASFALSRSSEQASFTYTSPEDADAINLIIQELTANSMTICEEISRNDALCALYRQMELLQQMIDDASVLTHRRGILMEYANLADALPLYQLDLQLWSCNVLLAQALLATVGVSCNNHAQNQRVINALLEFSDICSDYTRFDVTLELMLGILPTRQSLTPSQLDFLYALEGFMAVVNEPFWDDMYSNDPVITHIGVPISSSQRCPFFTIWLYDPDLKALTNYQLAEQTIGLREEIIEYIGLEAYRFEFRVAQDEGCETNSLFGC